jgi:hypothetical protein
MHDHQKLIRIVKLLIMSVCICAGLEKAALAYIGGSEPPNNVFPTLKLDLPIFALKIKSSDIIVLGLSSCSGVFIRSDMILTASHCILRTFIAKAPVLRYGRTREQMVIARVKAVFLHPDTGALFTASTNEERVFESGWAQKCEVPDIAIIQLDQPSSHFPIATVDHRPVLQWGSPLWIGGFGNQSPAHNVGVRAWHDLRGSSGTFKYYNKYCFVADTDEGGVAHGDSGGPVYIRYEDGTWGVVGVTSGMAIFRMVFFNLDKIQNFVRLSDSNSSSVPISKWFTEVQSGRAQPYYQF